jgi:hypothetical protein
VPVARAGDEQHHQQLRALADLTGLRRLKHEGPGHEVAPVQFLPYKL